MYEVIVLAPEITLSGAPTHTLSRAGRSNAVQKNLHSGDRDRSHRGVGYHIASGRKLQKTTGDQTCLTACHDMP